MSLGSRRASRAPWSHDSPGAPGGMEALDALGPGAMEVLVLLGTLEALGAFGLPRFPGGS